MHFICGILAYCVLSDGDVVSGLMKLNLSASNPNYFTNRERSCGNVKLDYIIHTWQSPSKVTENQDPSEDASHNFGLRPPRSGGGGVAIKVSRTFFLKIFKENVGNFFGKSKVILY